MLWSPHGGHKKVIVVIVTALMYRIFPVTAYIRSSSWVLGVRRLNPKETGIFMRDSSSVTWFRDGDRVRVAASIAVNGIDLKGQEGVCVDVWEKCEVDPHCCCAELAEEMVAVTVHFAHLNITYYFAEDELQRAPSANRTNSGGSTVAAAVSTLVAAASGAIAAPPDLTANELLYRAPIEDNFVAFALVFPLILYKAVSAVNGQRLLPTLDFAIAAAVVSACLYVLP